jgi:tyrosine-protein phosphatase YwqE
MQDESVADALGERYLLQVNATSLMGRHGPTPAAIGWRLLEEGRAALVASDGHRLSRPPYLDEAYALGEARLGPERASSFFDGSPLGLTSTAPPATSREAPRGV